MARHNVEIKVPVLSLDVSGEYSRFKKPTGLEHLILTAIGTDSLNEDTWAEFFKRLAIPERMTPLFRKVIDELHDNNVIDTNRFDTDDGIKNIGFTDTGRDLFEQGRIKQEPKTFHEKVFYVPFAGNSNQDYLFSLKLTDQNGFKAEKFRDITYDPDKLRRFITDNKSRFKAGREDEILSVIVEGCPEMLCTAKRLVLSFDEVSGDFLLETDIDTNFVKGYFSVPEILSDDSGSLSVSKHIVLKRVRPIPEEWTSYRYQLMSDFHSEGKLSVYNPSECVFEKAFALDALDFAFADIIGSKVGRGYVLSRKDVHIQGLDGSKELILLVSRPLSAEEIRRILEDVCNIQDLSDLEKFVKFFPVVGIANDEKLQNNIVRRHLEASRDIIKSIRELKRMKEFKQSKTLDSIIEDVLCDREKDVDGIVSILRACETKCDCDKICSKYNSGDDDANLKLADKLFSVCLKKGTVTAALGIRSAMLERILSGRIGDYKSKELIAMNDAAKALSDLRKYFGISSIKDYDLNKYDESSANDAIKAYSIASKSIAEINPLMAGSEKSSELVEYMDLIQNLTEVYCKDVPLDRLNGFQFGIGARRKIDVILGKNVKRSELKKMIDEAHKEGVIDDREQATFHKIREYGNMCAHTSDAPPVDSAEKREWVKTINDFEKRMKTKGVKK